MKKIISDQEAIKFIFLLLQGEPQTEEEWDTIEDLIEDYQVGISNILRSKEILSPEEILRLAREKNKPIIL